MNIFIFQIILAAPEEVDKWMDILFVVILAVFWFLRSFVKDKSKGFDSKADNRQQPSRKPQRGSSERAKSLWDQFIQQAREPYEPVSRKTNRPKVPQPQTKSSLLKGSAAHKVSSEPKKPSFERQIPEQPIKPKLSMTIPAVDSSMPEISDLGIGIYGLSGPEKKSDYLEDKPTHVAPEISEEYIYEDLFDHSHPEELQKAILHYEILGRPLSLRNQSDNF